MRKALEEAGKTRSSFNENCVFATWAPCRVTRAAKPGAEG